MALTAKKRAFADAVLAGKSHKEAACAAGYSAKTASPAGSRLAKDPDVAAYLVKHRGKKARKTGHTLPNGQKAADAPKNWPFGAQPPAPPPPPELPKVLTAREYLSQVMNNVEVDEKLRIDAAKKLIDFEEAKPAPVGKKAAQDAEAKKRAGRFSPGAPPKLAAVGGRKV